MSRGRLFFRIIVGGYLAYIGAGLTKDAFVEKPDNYIIFAGVGILFLGIGLGWLIRAVLMAARHEYVDPDDGAKEIDRESLLSDEDVSIEESTEEETGEEETGIEEQKNEQTTDREE